MVDGARGGFRLPVARHGRLGTPGFGSALAKFLIVALCVAVVSTVSVTAIATWRLAQDFGKHTVDLGGPGVGAISGAVNLLIVGDDTREGQKGHYGTDPGSALNDVNILLHISADHTKATVISIPRDTYVDIPSCKNATTGETLSAETDVKINSALSYGGVGCIRDTVAKLTGLTIPYVALITFDGVVEMSNAVGGVPVCVASAINDDYTGLHLSKGEHTLKGAKALEFLRTRHGVGDGSDLTRITSQQVFLSSLVRTMKSSATLTDVTKLYSLARAAADSMTLSTSLADVDTIVSIAKAVAPIDLAKVVFVQYPTTIEGDGVVPNTEAADVLMKAVSEDKTIVLGKRGEEAGAGSVIEGSGSSATSTPSPSATKSASSSTVQLPDGVTGQTAAQKSCSVGNDLGTR